MVPVPFKEAFQKRGFTAAVLVCWLPWATKENSGGEWLGRRRREESCEHMKEGDLWLVNQPPPKRKPQKQGLIKSLLYKSL